MLRNDPYSVSSLSPSRCLRLEALEKRILLIITGDADVRNLHLKCR